MDLVIGYGNELRGDDGVGPKVAEAVEAWKLAGVSVLALRQLTPELAADLAVVRRVIFVDAALPQKPTSPPPPLLTKERGGQVPGLCASSQNHSAENRNSHPVGSPQNWGVGGARTREIGVSLTRLLPSTDREISTHFSDPAGLLALADILYGHAPQAYLLTIPTVHFDMDAPLSATAEAGIEMALRTVRALLQEGPPDAPK